MAKVRVVWHRAGFTALRSDPGVLADLNARADRIAAAAGEGFGTRDNPHQGGKSGGRARAIVITETTEAIKAERESHVLLKALGAGGGS